MKQSNNKKSRDVTAFLYERLRLSKNPVLKQLKTGFFVFSMKLSQRSKFCTNKGGLSSKLCKFFYSDPFQIAY